MRVDKESSQPYRLTREGVRTRSESIIERDRGIAHGRADAGFERKLGGARRDAQIEGGVEHRDVPKLID